MEQSNRGLDASRQDEISKLLGQIEKENKSDRRYTLMMGIGSLALVAAVYIGPGLVKTYRTGENLITNVKESIRQVATNVASNTYFAGKYYQKQLSK